MQTMLPVSLANRLQRTPPELHLSSRPRCVRMLCWTLLRSARHWQFQWARTAGATIERFGGFSAHDALGQDTLHSPKNAFTATYLPHSLFDALSLWLTPALVRAQSKVIIVLLRLVLVPLMMDGDQDAQRQVIPDTYDVCHAEWLHNNFKHSRIRSRVVFRSIFRKDQFIPHTRPRSSHHRASRRLRKDCPHVRRG
ncbi:hypothetical protein BV20DRAFT_68663 [Pilatotrama ljubarskyi]|nr:hypothetical protein BV20DRAFT_68663 [Pilatotrama ljubarskyi]